MTAIPESFLRFAEECADASPLYSGLSRSIANDDGLLELAGEATSIPVTNLFFGAVHALLLAGAEHELSGLYPSVSDEIGKGDPFPAFRSFCIEHRDGISRILKTRRVQTNEPRRSALLLPAFGLIEGRAGRALDLVEVGASAGLNLIFDRFAFDYGPHGGIGTSDVEITCEVRGGSPPIPKIMPRVSSRVGLDLAPLDVSDEGDARWLFALIWPESFRERSRTLSGAIEAFAAASPELIPGDALTTLPNVLEDLPEGANPVVFHSFTMNQFPPEARRRFRLILREHAPLYELSVGWKPGEKFASIELTEHPDGQPELLARCDAHGAWLDWEEPPPRRLTPGTSP